MIDIDYFKNFNDTQGHGADDECLKLVAKIIDASLLRGIDSVSRYGGEEFVVLLPNTDLDGAILVSQRIQENLSKVAIIHRVSISVISSPLAKALRHTIPISVQLNLSKRRITIYTVPKEQDVIAILQLSKYHIEQYIINSH
ncbi:diguanylate cyclase [Photobacterium leiognathi]|uniref:diguanylate cyclase n=1 Tax=Photobacterium leiognathi TaxID=553611 RepID=UPI003F741DE5